jgi:hypothetical protein
MKLTIIRTPKKASESMDIIKQECPSSLDCLLLNSRHRLKIKELFEHFKNFNSLKTVLPLGGAKGTNADVILLTYNFKDYETKALMKIQKSANADNLVYEYLMGLQMNRYLQFLPNFLETYSLYETDKPHEDYKSIIKFRSNFKYNSKSNDEKLQQGIKEPTKNALLIEYVHNSEKLDRLVADADFLEHELIPVLFQIYYALYKLKGKFVHYDLHCGNVMLYKPYNGQYMRFRYMIDGISYDFYSKYMVKIIDYGRAYTVESFDVHKSLCKIQKDCGRYAGFAVSDKTRTKDFYFDYMKPNPSSDLRLLHQLNRLIKHKSELMQELFEPLKPLANTSIGTREDALPPEPTSGDDKLNNITDAYQHLLRMLEKIPSYKPAKRADIVVHGLTKAYEVIEGSETSNSESESSIEDLNQVSERTNSLNRSSNSLERINTNESNSERNNRSSSNESQYISSSSESESSKE